MEANSTPQWANTTASRPPDSALLISDLAEKKKHYLDCSRSTSSSLAKNTCNVSIRVFFRIRRRARWSFMLCLAFQCGERSEGRELRPLYVCRKEDENVLGKEGKCFFYPFIARIRCEELQTHAIKPLEIEVTILRAP